MYTNTWYINQLSVTDINPLRDFICLCLLCVENWHARLITVTLLTPTNDITRSHITKQLLYIHLQFLVSFCCFSIRKFHLKSPRMNPIYFIYFYHFIFQFRSYHQNKCILFKSSFLLVLFNLYFWIHFITNNYI